MRDSFGGPNSYEMYPKSMEITQFLIVITRIHTINQKSKTRGNLGWRNGNVMVM